MLSRSNWLIIGLAVLAAAAGGYLQHRLNTDTRTTVASPLVGQLAADLELAGVDGQSYRLADYRGRRVLLNFWASWCVPCLQEMPALNQAQNKFGDHGAIVLGIAMDEPERVRDFLATHPVSYPILLGQLAAPSTSMQWGDTGEVLPYSVLIDADGRVIDAYAGPLDSSQLQRWLGSPATVN